MTRSRALAIGLILLGAVQGLGAEERPVVLPADRLAQALGQVESSDPYQRQLGFLRLEALRDPSSIEAITRYVDSRDPDMRAYSLRALAAIEGPKAVPMLLERLKSEKHPRVRRTLLLGLEPLQPADPAILPALLGALLDRDTEVRMTAVDIVSRIDDPRAKHAILERNRREGRRDVRRVLGLAMKRIGQ